MNTISISIKIFFSVNMMFQIYRLYKYIHTYIYCAVRYLIVKKKKKNFNETELNY